MLNQRIFALQLLGFIKKKNEPSPFVLTELIP